jgi:HEAT repeat protein
VIVNKRTGAIEFFGTNKGPSQIIDEYDRKVLEELGLWDKIAADRVKRLIYDLKSPEHAAREAAAKSLSQLGPAARSAVSALIDALIAEPVECPSIGRAICTLATGVPDVDALRAALRNPNFHVRFWASRALVLLGRGAEPAIPELIQALADTASTVSDTAAWALGSIGEPSIAPLCEAVANGDNLLRCKALLALGRYVDHISAKLQTVISALDDDSPDIQRAAARAVCSLAQGVAEKRRRDSLSAAEQDALPPLRMAIRRIEANPGINESPDWTSRVAAWLDANPS